MAGKLGRSGDCRTRFTFLEPVRVCLSDSIGFRLPYAVVLSVAILFTVGFPFEFTLGFAVNKPVGLRFGDSIEFKVRVSVSLSVGFALAQRIAFAVGFGVTQPVEFAVEYVIA